MFKDTKEPAWYGAARKKRSKVLHWILGQEEKKESQEAFGGTYYPSHLESRRFPFCQTDTEDDVVLCNMQAAKRRSTGHMSFLQGTLVQSMGGSQNSTCPKQEREGTREDQETAGGDQTIASGQPFGGIPRSSSLGTFNSANKECDEEQYANGVDADQRQGAVSHTATAGAATSAQFEERGAHRGRDEDAMPFEGFGRHDISDSGNERSVIIPRGKGRIATIEQDIVPQSHPSNESCQRQSRDDIQKDSIFRFELEELCSDSDAQGSGACGLVSDMPCKPARDLQWQSRGSQCYQRRSGTCITELDCTQYRGDEPDIRGSGCGAVSEGSASGSQRRRIGLQHFGGRGCKSSRAGGCQHGEEGWGRSSAQEACEATGFAAFSNIDLAQQSGQSALEERAQGQQRQQRFQRRKGCETVMSEVVHDRKKDELLELQIEEFAILSQDIYSELNAYYVKWSDMDVIRSMDVDSDDEATLPLGFLGRKTDKQVRFDSHCDVHLRNEDDESIDMYCICSSLHGWLRCFWHLRGQASTWANIKAVCAKIQHVPWMNMIDAGHIYACSDAECGVDSQEVPADLSLSKEQDIERMNIPAHRIQTCLQHRERPIWIKTWFLANGRFHLCVSARRLQISQGSDLAALKDTCGHLWQDVLEGDEFDTEMSLSKEYSPPRSL